MSQHLRIPKYQRLQAATVDCDQPTFVGQSIMLCLSVLPIYYPPPLLLVCCSILHCIRNGPDMKLSAAIFNADPLDVSICIASPVKAVPTFLSKTRNIDLQ